MSNTHFISTDHLPILRNAIEDGMTEQIDANNKKVLKYIDNKNEELSKNIGNDIDILVTEVAKLELKSNRLENKLSECKMVFYITYIILGVLLIISLVFNIISYKMISQKLENQIQAEQIVEETSVEEILSF